MSARSTRAVLGAATALALALLALLTALDGLTGSASAAVGSHRVGSAPVLPRGAQLTGNLASGTEIPVDVALNPRDPAALAAYAQAVSTPGSAEYHQYLTVAQFRLRFAPTDAQIATVRAGLTSAGLTPSAVSANGLLIHVRASADQLASAFSTRLDTVRLASGRTAFANTAAPQLSTSLSGLVQGVVGLDDLIEPHALGLERATATVPTRAHTAHPRTAVRPASQTAHTSAVTPCADATAATTAQLSYGIGGYTADQIATGYGLDNLYAQGDEGAGETVAMIEFEAYSSTDIAQYEDCYGISGRTPTDASVPTDVSETDIDGGLGTDYTGGAAGQGEAALDIEQVVGLAPAAHVAVYEAPVDGDTGELDAYSAMADSTAKIISTSWGECEADAETDPSAVQAESTIFEMAATRGISVYAAAGDSGSSDCSYQNSYSPGLAVDDPAAQPDVTSVGGTTLPSTTDDAEGIPDPGLQFVWNESAYGYGAGGGGVSTLFAMPAYQSGAASSLGVVNADSASGAACDSASGTYCREVPDVSADGDLRTGYEVDHAGSWQTIGGTSAAAPLWAAMTALADASTSCASAPVGFANPVLYAIASNATEDAADFTDITEGNNAYSPTGYNGSSYPAGTGYDMASGLGTPNAATLVPDMCSQVATTAPVAPTTPATTPPPTPTATPAPAPTPAPASTPAPVSAPKPTTTSTPAPATSPALPKLTITAPRAGQTSANVAVSCPAGTEGCSVTATFTIVETVKRGKRVPAATMKKTVVLGSAHLTLKAARKGTLTLALNAAGKTLLAKQHTLKLTLTITNNGETISLRTVTLKRATRHVVKQR